MMVSPITSTTSDDGVQQHQIQQHQPSNNSTNKKKNSTRENNPSRPAVQMIPREDIEIGHFLGSGSYSSVFAVRTMRSSLRLRTSSSSSSSDDDDDDDEEEEDDISSTDDVYGEKEENDDDDSTTTTITNRSTSSQEEPLVPKYAIKCLHDRTLKCPKRTKTAAKDLAYEAVILSRYSHPSIIGLYAISSDFWTDKQSRFLVLDYIVETLEERLHRLRKEQQQQQSSSASNRRYSLSLLSLRQLRQRRIDIGQEQEKRAVDMGLPIARAMEYLHQNKIIFKDLKTKNLGFDACGTLRMFDFGLARHENEIWASSTSSSKTKTKKCGGGTIRYMAPECYSRPNSRQSDVYSYTMVLWEIVTLQRLFPKVRHLSEMKQLVVNHDIRPPLKEVVPYQLRRLLKNGWHWDYTRRPTFESIVKVLEEETSPSCSGN